MCVPFPSWKQTLVPYPSQMTGLSQLQSVSKWRSTINLQIRDALIYFQTLQHHPSTGNEERHEIPQLRKVISEHAYAAPVTTQRFYIYPTSIIFNIILLCLLAIWENDNKNNDSHWNTPQTQTSQQNTANTYNCWSWMNGKLQLKTGYMKDYEDRKKVGKWHIPKSCKRQSMTGALTQSEGRNPHCSQIKHPNTWYECK